MKTKIVISTFFLAVIFISLSSFNLFISSDKGPLEKYSRVRIYLNSESDILTLAKNDITIDEYYGNIKTGIDLEINQEELSRLGRTNLRYEVLIPDMDIFYKNQPPPTPEEMQRSKEIMEKDGIQGFTYGSMGGFHTYLEVVAQLDTLKNQYPNLVSVKQNIGTSHENRTLWAVKVSDNPNSNESITEPAVYFDGLHHAREPMTEATIIYFIYYLCENYGTNTEVTYLLNNREIFFVPVVNPDGYVYNQTTNPSGGGSWRKNRRVNSPGVYGVDLNRNYSYGWGYNSGSSSDPNSDTYRGPSPLSEPESQAVAHFTDSIHPKIAFSMHSNAGVFINPYGYTDTVVKYEVYSDYASEMAPTNNFLYGNVYEMLGYYSSGTTRDYLHVHGTYCWTPELGGTSFWPSQSQIIPLASVNITSMKYLCWVGGGFVRMQNYYLGGKGYVYKSDTLQLFVNIRNKGLSKYSKNVNVNLTSLYANALPLVASVGYDSIAPGQSKTNVNPFKFRITTSANVMDEMKFVCAVSQEGVLASTDTIIVNVGKTNILFYDNAENGTSNWTKSGNQIQWDTTFAGYWTGAKSFSDSRYGNSKNSTTNYFTLNNTINLANKVNPKIEYACKFATETGYDYCRIQISTNNGTSWINMAGRHTTTLGGQPSYVGLKYWKNEQINLNPYIGQNIKIRFNYYTDSGTPGDGFYFDEFRVVDYRDTATSTALNKNEIPDKYELTQNYPNPFNPSTLIRYSLKNDVFVSLKIYDLLGREVANLISEYQKAGRYEHQVSIDEYRLSSGVYYYRITAGDFSDVRSMVVLK